MNSGIIIAGPTGSGKSTLALEIAHSLSQAVIINADSMQVYKDLKILSARPNLNNESIPHYLYGLLNAHEFASVGWWSQALDTILSQLPPRIIPIVVGGTGMYLKVLCEGISPMPTVPAKIREQGQALYNSIGHEAFKKLLHNLDPTTTVNDKQRILRAWEVVTYSGKSISYWQAQPKKRPLSFQKNWKICTLMPYRNTLYPLLNHRFSQMVLSGGLDEVRSLSPTNNDHGIYKAIGVPELLSYLQGNETLESAILKGQNATRHYAKRQLTWFRHQLKADLIIPDCWPNGDWTVKKIMEILGPI